MRKLLLVGWRSADWSMIHPLIDRGDMPRLQHVVENGVSGPLATINPMVSPMTWTSVVTGTTADQHGILGVVEPDPVSGGARQSTSTSRTRKAIWNILNQTGRRVHVVSWPASHPAEPIRGICVSDAFCTASDTIPAGAVHPAHLERVFAGLRLTPRDLTGADLSLFVPHLRRVDQQRDTRLIALARTISEGLTAHAAATWILEHEAWDFLAVHFDSLGQAARTFMPFHPPRMAHVSEEDVELYGEVMRGAYRFHDLMLGRLIDLAGPDATVMVVSEHGYTSGIDRPQASSVVPIDNPALWYRRHGIFCLAGPGIRKDELVHGAGVLDVAPTILVLYGVPLAEDMPGRPLVEALEDAPEIRRLRSWEIEAGEAGTHPPRDDAGEPETAAALQQLRELGYEDATADGAEERRRSAVKHQGLNAARVLIANGRPLEAVARLEALLEEFPDDLAVQVQLAEAHFRAGNYDRSEGMAYLLLDGQRDRPLDQLLQANSAFFRGDRAKALESLALVERTDAVDARLSMLVGQLYLRLQRPADAERHYRRALEIDDRSGVAWRGLSLSLLEQKRYSAAAEAALDAVGFEYGSPTGHFLLGVALAASGRIDHAVRALETCVRLQPHARLAHRWLDRIHTQLTGDHERAQHHRAAAAGLEAGGEPTREVPSRA